jgi:hypothetical protein
MSDILTVGEEVMHRDGFGSDPPRKARVKQIEILHTGNPDDGEIVKEILWTDLTRSPRAALVILDNGKWAYGDQVDRINTDYPKLEVGRRYETNDGRHFRILSSVPLVKGGHHFKAECHEGETRTTTRYFTENGGCVAYFRADEPILEAARSIATDVIERTNKEQR